MARLRQSIVALAESWIGLNEKDGTHKEIIDIYNSGRKKGAYKVKYTDSWCATTVSALAIKLGYTDIIPIECSCGRMIELAKKMGIWVEDDAYTPQVGDILMYDWGDSGKGDCTGWPEHVGIVSKIRGTKLTVIEGNKNDAVGTRSISVNSRYIRGYIAPKYDRLGRYVEISGCYHLNIRSGPGTKHKIVGTLDRRDRVAILEESEGWGRIKDGWISLKYTVEI